MIVYKITNTCNGDSYIGQTSKTLKHRWTQHVWEALGTYNRSYNYYFHQAIRKYGPDAFSQEIIHVCETKEEMDFVETFYISFLNTKAPNGYNLTDGGEGGIGRIASKETREKLRKAKLGKKISESASAHLSELRRGKKRHPLSEKTKIKIANSLRGRPHSEARKQNISRGRKGKGMGRIVSDETKIKIGNANRRK
jgi:group I intron endonuclease